MGNAAPNRLLSQRLLRKPMLSARRVSLFAKQIDTQLSSAAVDLLFERASILSEGQEEHGTYFGSTMLTVDITRLRGTVSDPCDPSTAEQLSTIAGDDDRVLERATLVCREEAARLAPTGVTTTDVDVHVSHRGGHLHLDIDVEAHLSPRPPKS